MRPCAHCPDMNAQVVLPHLESRQIGAWLAVKWRGRYAQLPPQLSAGLFLLTGRGEL